MIDVLAAGRETFVNQFSVSHEYQNNLDRYAALLRTWNENINLVAASTIPDLWTRHFLDSAQLASHLPATARCVADIGSGAGFPGLVLGCMGVPDVHLIESVGKKAKFLQAVVDALKLTNVTVHNARVEDLRGLQVDVVTARAVTALPQLLSWSKPLMQKDSLCLFLKGQNADAELTEARKYWTFDCEKTTSLSDPSGAVLKISALKILRHHGNKPHRSNR